jgi:hypothetical protein
MQSPNRQQEDLRDRLRSFGSKAGSALGGVVVLGIFGFVFFSQCVAPFLDDDSETFTCQSPEMQGFCDDSGSIANFFVEACGRDQISFKGSLIGFISLGRDLQPDTVRLEILCGDRRYLDIETPPNATIETYADLRSSVVGSTSRSVLDIYEDWADFAITVAEARQRLLALD